jgi:ferric-dicitrate binding protein FerR (iron transport regulator)
MEVSLMRLGFRPPRSSRRLLAGGALIVAGLALAGCKEVPSNLVKSEPYELEAIKGTDLNRVKLADETAARIDLQTVQVRGNGKQKLVPHAALIYNPNGQVFVYTRPEPQTYVRAPVTVRRAVGDRAVLSKGPPIGTVVVTLGSAELLATEYEILNQHP